MNRRLAFGAGVASAIPLGYYLSDSQSKIYKYMMEAGRYLTGKDAEQAHQLGILLAKYALMPADRVGNPPILATKVWGISFPNPVGLAAGFDKNGESTMHIVLLKSPWSYPNLNPNLSIT